MEDASVQIGFKLHFKPTHHLVWLWFAKIRFHVVFCCSDFLKPVWIQSGNAKNPIWAGSLNNAKMSSMKRIRLWGELVPELCYCACSLIDLACCDTQWNGAIIGHTDMSAVKPIYKCSGLTGVADAACLRKWFNSILEKRKLPLHTLPSPHHHNPKSRPVLFSTYCSQRHWHFVDVMYKSSCLPPAASPLQLTRAVRFKNDSQEAQWTLWQVDSEPTRGCGMEGHSGLCPRDSEAFLAPPAYVWWEKCRKRRDGTEIQQPNNQSLYMR